MIRIRLRLAVLGLSLLAGLTVPHHGGRRGARRHHRGAAPRQGRTAGDPAPLRIRRRGAGVQPGLGAGALVRAGPPRRRAGGDRAVAAGRGPGAGTGARRRGPQPGRRPALYWARLGMTREVRTWQPRFGLTGRQQDALLDAVERTSRGQTDIRYPAGGRPRRVLLTGFDPFTLDRDIRISNPSGATALALDGTVVETAAGPARIETAVFPVRWQDFAEGTVERTLRPYLPKADLFTTVSQGRVGRFDRAHQRRLARRLPGQRQRQPHGAGAGRGSGDAAAVDDHDPAVRRPHGRAHRAFPGLRQHAGHRDPRREAARPSYGRTGRPPAPRPGPGAAATTCPTRSPTGPPCCGTGSVCTARCRAGMCTPRCCSSAPGTPPR